MQRAGTMTAGAPPPPPPPQPAAQFYSMDTPMGYPVGPNPGAAAAGAKIPKLNRWDESHDAIINGLKVMYASKVRVLKCEHL